MKSLIKSGLCLAFGWLANVAGAQEVPIKWQAAKTPNSAIRPVTLNQPTPLDSFAPIIRGLPADDKKITPIPMLEVSSGEPEPKKMPKDKGFTPPPPTPTPSSMPAFASPCADDCGGGICRPLAHWGHFFRGNGECCPERPCFWASAEYLMWWQRGQDLPPLVTGTPVGSTSPIGVLPGATVLYDSVPNSMHSGGRFTFGWWCPRFCNNLGVDLSYMFLGRQTNSATFDSGNGMFLGRPFFSVINNGSNAEVFLGTDRNGSATVTNFSQLWGLEANLRYKWRCGPSWWVDALIGYRHLNLSEGIDIQENLNITSGPFAGTSFVENESFRTRNQFNGIQFGLEGECRFWSRWSLGWSSKIAAGSLYQIINTDASTTRTLPGGAPQTQPGALLITQTNQGRLTTSRFSVAPELGVKFGYDLTDHLRLFVGYDILYVTNVVRPGEQIDLRVNSDLRPFTGNTTSAAPRVPQIPFRTSDYWAQGLNFGLLYRY